MQDVSLPPLLLASDGTSLFWRDADNVIWSVPRSGGAPKQITDLASQALLDVDSTYVYFVSDIYDGIGEVPKQGGVNNGILDGPNIYAAAVFDGSVYWLDSATTFIVNTGSLSGEATTQLGVLESESHSTPSIAATPSWIFFVGNGNLYILPRVGGTPRLLVAGAGCASLLASGGDSVFCANSPLTLIDATGAETEIAAVTENVTSMAIDDTNVYWVNDIASGSVMTAPKQGGVNSMIASDAFPTAVAVNDVAVYWGDEARTIQRALR